MDALASARLAAGLMEVVSDAVLVVGLADLRIEAHNAEAARLYDVAREGLVGARYDEAVAIDPRSAREALRQRRDFVPLRFHRRCDGTHLPVEIRIRYVEDEDGGRALLAIRRVSEREVGPRHENEAEAKFRAIFDSSAFPILMVDGHGLIIDANGCAEACYRFPARELIGMPLARLTGSEELARNLYLSRPTFVPAAEHRRADGSAFLAEMLISYPQLPRRPWALALVRDVTEEQRAYRLLKESEYRWQCALEGHGDGVWDWDLADDSLWVSEQFKNILGFSEGDEIRHWPQLIHPRDLDRFRRSIGDHLARRSALHESEFRMRCRDDAYRWVASRGRVVSADQHGRPLRMIGTLRDIDEAHGAQERERQQLQELAHAGRLITLGETASVLAHEINQPLTAIRNFSAVAQRRLPRESDATLQEAIGMISAQAMRAGEVVHRIRDFMRKSPPRWEPVAINELAAAMIGFVKFEAEQHGLELATRFDPALPTIRADRLQIGQVVLNLIRNAIESMDAGAPVQSIEVRSFTRPEGIELQVADAGVGLTGAARTALFEPFVTTKAEGSGLGLAICRSIVESHKGSLWARPNSPRGMIFGFELPFNQRT